MHHVAFITPRFLVLGFVFFPIVLQFERFAVVRREFFDLLLGQVGVEVVGMLFVSANLVGGNDEAAMLEPAAGVNHGVADTAGGVLEDDVINGAEFFVSGPVEQGAAQVVGF